VRTSRGGYAVLSLGAILGGFWWLAQQAAAAQTWWQKIPFATLLEFWGAFAAGFLLAELNNGESALRAWVRRRRRLFEIEGVDAAHRSTPQREWLEITVRLKFARSASSVRLITRVDALTNIAHARSQFVLYNEPPSDVAADEQRKLVLAVVPLRTYDGAIPGPQCWGRYREPGDVAGVIGFVEGGENVVEIEARTPALWRRQRERIFLAALYTDSHSFGRVFIARDGEPENLEVVPS